MRDATADLLIRTWIAPRKLLYLRALVRLIVVLPFLTQHATHATPILARRGVQASLLFAGLVLTASAIAVYFAERSSGGSIDSLDTAFWWAITTATTVGYGDKVPVTPLGRGIAVVLMIVGIGVFAVLTANVAAFLFESREPTRDPASDEVLEELRRLHARLDAAGLADGEVEPVTSSASGGGPVETGRDKPS